MESENARTAGDAGWHTSRYNLFAKIPGDTKGNVAIANLYKGTCAPYNPIELYLLSALEELDEHHPVIERFAKRGIIANFDERAALEVMGRAACANSRRVSLTICPTMGCNFDCPYCFERHTPSFMSQEVQDDVVALAGRMLDAARPRILSVTWFGGEPLLAPKVIESLSERLMQLAKEHEVKYSAHIITNGYFLTPDIVEMLDRAKVGSAQVTLDGVGASHDVTRHLAGGGPTFERIIGNLRQPDIPFHVHIRHNVHDKNADEVEPLRLFVERLAQESGNSISYYPTLVNGSEAADERGGQVGLLCGSTASEIGIAEDSYEFSAGRGHYCGAHTLWSVGIDQLGNLQKCWETVDKPSHAFGTAHDWDPMNPFETASNVDNLTAFLNTAGPIPDAECQDCVWLPTCVGGCPYRRLYCEGRVCVPYKDHPEDFVLALFRRVAEVREAREAKETNGQE